MHFYKYVYSEAAEPYPMDAALFCLYFCGVAVCFACFACCHIIWNVSAPTAAFGNRLDFCGIVLLMWGASLPSIHYAFICEPVLKHLHWTLISLSAMSCIATTLHPRFSRPAFRKSRATMYTCFGLSAIFFLGHSIALYGLAVQRKRLAIGWIAVMGGLNVLSAGVYASRVPERWLPNRFDYVGASHQIFHVQVLAAGLVHYQPLICAFRESRVWQDLRTLCPGLEAI